LSLLPMVAIQSGGFYLQIGEGESQSVELEAVGSPPGVSGCGGLRLGPDRDHPRCGRVHGAPASERARPQGQLLAVPRLLRAASPPERRRRRRLLLRPLHVVNWAKKDASWV